MYLLRLKTEARIIWQIAARLLLLGAFSNCVPPSDILAEIWGVGWKEGENSLSEESVWAAGRSVTAGDLEMLLQSPTKEKNQDNKALIPPRTTASIWQSRLYRQEDGRAKTGPGWTRLPEHGGRQLHQGEAVVQAAISCWDGSLPSARILVTPPDLARWVTMSSNSIWEAVWLGS